MRMVVDDGSEPAKVDPVLVRLLSGPTPYTLACSRSPAYR